VFDEIRGQEVAMMQAVKAGSQLRGRSERWSTRPSLEEVASIAGRNADIRAVPIFREVLADLETPVSAFLKIRGSGPAFLLESIEGGERLARYSFIGSEPIAVLTMSAGKATLESAGGQTTVTAYDDPLVPLADLVAARRAPEMPNLPLPRFTGGAVGYLSYEAVRAFEPRVPSAPGAGLELPDGVWMLTDALLVFDHLARTIKAVAHVSLDDDLGLSEAYDRAEGRIDELIARLRTEQPTMPIGGELSQQSAEERQSPNTSRERYLEMVETAREYIAAEYIFQVGLSQ